MIIKIQNYKMGKCYIGSFSSSVEVDDDLKSKGLNIIHYNNGLVFLGDHPPYEVDEDSFEFWQSLNDYDVVEVYDSGEVRLQYSSCTDDNTLFITSKCNSNCVMCPSSDYSRREGVIPEVGELLDIVRHYPLSAKHITITGGEPFLFREHMFDVLSELKRLEETEFLVLTNGRVFCMDKYVERLVESLPKRTIVAIPIHGSSEMTHDAITRVPNSFAQTASGISKLLAAEVLVEIRVVVSRVNVLDLYDTACFIATHFPKTFRVHFIGLEMLGNAYLNRKEVWIPYSEACDYMTRAADALISSGINVAFYNFPLCVIDRKYWPICKKSISDYKRKFPEVCEKCCINSMCGGVFAGSLRFAENELRPFEDRKND